MSVVKQTEAQKLIKEHPWLMRMWVEYKDKLYNYWGDIEVINKRYVTKTNKPELVCVNGGGVGGIKIGEKIVLAADIEEATDNS